MNGFLVISNATDLLRVRHDNIVYVSSDGNYSQMLLAGGEMRLLSIQLGQLESLIDQHMGPFRHNFIRIGKSLIINRSFIFHINISKQQLVLCDNLTAKYTVQASREALKQLKTLIENEHERA